MGQRFITVDYHNRFLILYHSASVRTPEAPLRDENTLASAFEVANRATSLEQRRVIVQYDRRKIPADDGFA